MRLAPAVGGGNATFAYIRAHSSHLWVEILCGVGIVSVVFHLVGGFACSLSTWGIVRGRKSQFALSLASWVFMMFLWLWWFRIFFQFAG
jgi:succinate dehydrogenase/fumarate reductase cytochrome b subunit